MALQRALLSSPASPAACEERGGLGKLRPAAWAGEETVNEPRRRYLKESREELRQTQTRLSRAISAPQPVDSDTLSLTQHGSDLDPVRCEAEKRQCQVQSSGYAQRRQLQLLILSCKYFILFVLFTFHGKFTQKSNTNCQS